LEPFQSVIWRHGEDTRDSSTYPEFMVDLRLDVFFEEMVKGKEEFGLRSLVASPPSDLRNIVYRQEVFRDLEDARLIGGIREFCDKMRRVYGLIKDLDHYPYPYQKERLVLDAAEHYVEAVSSLFGTLRSAPLGSEAMKALRDHVDRYMSSRDFRVLDEDIRAVLDELAKVVFSVTIKGTKITVRPCGAQDDYSEDVAHLFSKFGGNQKPRLRVKQDYYGTSHVEAYLLELVARFYPYAFKRLKQFYEAHSNFIEPVLEKFYREIQFYLSYLDYIDVLRKAGLPFCVPTITTEKDSVYANDTFDVELASRLVKENKPVVLNRYEFGSTSRILVVTGPNSGGKTTFARTVGQTHYLANLGYPVPGTSARLLKFDNVFTHFERSEAVENLRSKLEDDLYRVKRILEAATDRSVIIINELFGSTAATDASVLGRSIIERISGLGCLCVYVTFLDELASLGNTASYVALVDPEDPAQRTFRVVRRPADGLAYAMAIAKKYGLTTEDILRRAQ
jgi:DNA mismatch repair protein MutS